MRSITKEQFHSLALARQNGQLNQRLRELEINAGLIISKNESPKYGVSAAVYMVSKQTGRKFVNRQLANKEGYAVLRTA